MSIKTIAKNTPAGRALTATEIATKAQKLVEKTRSELSASDAFLQEEAQGAPVMSIEERVEVELTEEQKLTKAEKQRKKFNDAIIEERVEHVPGGEHMYHSRAGIENLFETEDQDVLLYLLAGQPNAPQLTANATESRGGSAPMSD